MMKQYKGLIKFGVLMLLILTVAVTNFHYSTTMQIEESNITEVSYMYGSGPQWQDSYVLTEQENIEAVVDMLEHLELEAAVPRKVNETLFSSDAVKAMITIFYDDLDKAKVNNAVYSVLILKDGHVVLFDYDDKTKQYKIDDTAELFSVLDEQSKHALIGASGIAMKK